MNDLFVLISEAWTWINENGQGLEGVGSILALTVIYLTARQVGVASAQRDVSDSFELSRRFDELLRDWSKAQVGSRDRELGALVGPIEVAAASINHRRFSKVAKYFVRHLVKDALSLIVAAPDSATALRNWMSDREVCRQIRLFLVENFPLVSRATNYSTIYATFFVGRSVVVIWDDCVGASVVRWWYARRLRLGWE